MREPAETKTPRKAQSLQRRMMPILGATLVFALLFTPAYGLISRSAIVLAVAPIIAAASQFGWMGGLVAGLVSVPADILLFLMVGESDPATFLGRNFLFSHAVFVGQSGPCSH